MGPKAIIRSSCSQIRAGQEDALHCPMPCSLKGMGKDVPTCSMQRVHRKENETDVQALHVSSDETFLLHPSPSHQTSVWQARTLTSPSGRSNTLIKGDLIFELLVIGAKAKNILILRSSSGMDEKAMKPVGGRRKQTLPGYF